mgnify:FL=1
MIFYFEVTTKGFLVETEKEYGLIVAQNYSSAAKQIEDAMYDILLSINKLEPIDNTNIIYLTDIPISEQLIQSIKEKAVW